MRRRTRRTTRITVGMNCRRAESPGGPPGTPQRSEACVGSAGEGGGRGRGHAPATANPFAKAQYNFTDPESRVMKTPDGFAQAYNTQIAADDRQWIVGQAVTQDTQDKQQLLPMITIIERQTGETPTQVLADAGYCSEANLTGIAALPVDGYISTRKQKHGERPGPCTRGRMPTTATVVARMTRQLQAKAGAAVYATRKAMVETFGQIKRRAASGGSCSAAIRRCRASGRSCARRTTFSSCTACVSDPV